METPPLLRTALHDTHVRAGAKMVPFAGYDMPVQYEGLKAEHEAVRTRVGMFDVSHMGEFVVEGADALAFLQWVTSNDVAKLVDGKVQYSCMPNGTGGIVDDLLVYRFSETKYLLVVNASNMAKDWAWLDEQRRAEGFDVTMENQSDAWSLIALQGPLANDVLKSLASVRQDGAAWNELPYYTFVEANVHGHSSLISATGYTGAGGVEMYLPHAVARTVWDELLQAGVTPCGLGARDTLRIEMGFCLYGNDIDDCTSPIAAGLGWITKFSKDFVDKKRLANEKNEGPARRLIGLWMDDRGIPRHGYEVEDGTGRVVGHVTSGTMSPSLGVGIGMAYIEASLAQEGTPLQLVIRNKKVPCHVVRFPFYKGHS